MDTHPSRGFRRVASETLHERRRVDRVWRRTNLPLPEFQRVPTCPVCHPYKDPTRGESSTPRTRRQGQFPVRRLPVRLCRSRWRTRPLSLFETPPYLTYPVYAKQGTSFLLAAWVEVCRGRTDDLSRKRSYTKFWNKFSFNWTNLGHKEDLLIQQTHRILGKNELMLRTKYSWYSWYKNFIFTFF